jgi:uncharacterized protein (TIGR02145 family)
MIRGIRPGCLLFLITPILFSIIWIRSCHSDRNNKIETHTEIKESWFELPTIPFSQTRNNYHEVGYEYEAYKMPNKRKKSFGDKKYIMLDFGAEEWMGEDLNYEVEGSYLYNDPKHNSWSWSNRTRFYDLQTANTLCAAFNMVVPTSEDWLDLLVFTGGNGSDSHSDQGFHKNRAFGKLTVSDGIGFDVDFNGFGFIYDNGEVSFEGKEDIIYYWTSSYDSEYPSQPIVIAFEKNSASVIRYRISNAHRRLFACRCIKK